MSDLNLDTQFDFTYAPGVSTEQIIGFEMAGAVWSSYLDDDVAIRIHVESVGDLPEEVVGAALPGKKQKEKYDKIWEKMSGDATSDNDLLAFENLPSTDKEFSVVIDGQELNETKEFRLTNANAKSLDLLNDDRKKLDGYIVVNDFAGDSTVGWDYDALRNTNIEGNNIDFLSVALHETGHILGFTSGIDDDGWLEALTKSQSEEKELKDKDFKYASALDLYRYSDSSSDSGKLDLSIGGNPYFSIDGGNTSLGSFANGEYTDLGGDGYQASHWQQGSNQGIMNPILPVGERRDVSDLDLTAMDVIGWDLNTSELPSWNEMYDSAVANAETATIEDRSKDVEKMIRESGYDGRRSRRSTFNRYYFQVNEWQFTTLEPADDSTIVVEEDSVAAENPETEPDLESTDTAENPETELDSESTDSVFLEPDSEELIPEDDFDDSEAILEDDFDITGVDNSKPEEDSVAAENLETELDLELTNKAENPETELDLELTNTAENPETESGSESTDSVFMESDSEELIPEDNSDDSETILEDDDLSGVDNSELEEDSVIAENPDTELGSESTDSVFIESDSEELIPEDNFDDSEPNLGNNYDITGIDNSELETDSLLSGAL